MTFLCDTSWENQSILSVKNFRLFGNSRIKGYKITFVLNSLVSSFCFHKIYIFHMVV